MSTTIETTQTVSPALRSEVVIDDRATVPGWVDSVESFRRWVNSDEFPERGRFSFLAGRIWVDLSMEQLFTHNAVKTQFTRILANLQAEQETGYLFSDGTLYTHPGAALSTEPDALFVFHESIKAGRVKLVEGAESGYVELEGSADMVLEIVSPTTERKDTQVLPELYWTANVAEYWLVDAREGVRFTIHRWTPDGYEEHTSVDGWQHSAVFGRRFQLTQQTDPLGNPRFELMVESEQGES